MAELYDLKKDPGEMNNLARNPTYKKRICKMDSLLDEKIKISSIAPRGLRVIK